METSQKQHDKNFETVRKSYSTPQLQIYGDLREITQANGQSPKNDAPAGSKTV